jgi:anti-sigma regulatory factor (Ser/Thr protein kinase)
MADVTSEARVVALDRRWPADIPSRNGDLLDVVFGWPDFSRLRRLVAGQCAMAGLTGSRLDEFVLAVHEIAANAIVHASTSGRLVLRRTAGGLRCLVADHEDPGPAGRVPRARPGAAHSPEALGSTWGWRSPDESGSPEPAGALERVGTETGRGLWLAAQLADELSITSGPDRTTVSLYMRIE